MKVVPVIELGLRDTGHFLVHGENGEMGLAFAMLDKKPAIDGLIREDLKQENIYTAMTFTTPEAIDRFIDCLKDLRKEFKDKLTA